MARYKPTSKKNRLIKASRDNKSVPAWVVAKTKAKVKRTPTRNWRRSNLRL